MYHALQRVPQSRVEGTAFWRSDGVRARLQWFRWMSKPIALSTTILENAQQVLRFLRRLKSSISLEKDNTLPCLWPWLITQVTFPLTTPCMHLFQTSAWAYNATMSRKSIYQSIRQWGLGLTKRALTYAWQTSFIMPYQTSQECVDVTLSRCDWRCWSKRRSIFTESLVLRQQTVSTSIASYKGSSP